MSIEQTMLEVAGIQVDVVRKDIKNLHLGIYPPAGRVRVAAPWVVSDEAVRLAVIGKLPWIRAQRSRFEQQARQSRRELKDGESHYVFGRRYRLRVLQATGRSGVALRGVGTLALSVRRDSTEKQAAAVLERWYRRQLAAVVGPLLDQWGAKLGVQPQSWGLKRMKTKWGSCTPGQRRLWFNTELARKPIGCIEYIVVHELLHLRVANHGDEFISLLDQHLPRWRDLQRRLNAQPLAHEDWEPPGT